MRQCFYPEAVFPQEPAVHDKRAAVCYDETECISEIVRQQSGQAAGGTRAGRKRMRAFFRVCRRERGKE